MTTYVDLENACKEVYLNAGMEGIDSNSMLGKMLDTVKGFFSTVIAGGNEHIIEVDQKAILKVASTFNYADVMNRNAYMPRGLKTNYSDLINLLEAGRKYMGLVEKSIIPENVRWLAQVLAGNHTTSNAPMPRDGYRINMEKEINAIFGGKDVEMKPFNELYTSMSDFTTTAKQLESITADVRRGSVINLNKETNNLANITTRLIEGTKSGDIALSQVMLRTLAGCVMAVAAHAEMYSAIVSLGIISAEAMNNTAELFLKQGQA